MYLVVSIGSSHSSFTIVHLPRINSSLPLANPSPLINSSLPPSCGINYKFNTRYSSSEVLRDSSMRLWNPPIVIKKYQQAFLAPLPGMATGIEFIRLNLLARFLLVILVSLSIFPHILSLPYKIMGDKSVHVFSTPSAANVATGPNVINGDTNFELKPVLITMV